MPRFIVGSRIPGFCLSFGELHRQRWLRLAVGASSKNAPVILSRLGLDHWFDAVADGTLIKRSKPHPEVFLLAVEMLGLRPAAEQGTGTYPLASITQLLDLCAPG